MHCCPRSPFLSPLWAEMPYHRFGNSVVQHRAHPVETLRRMARRHSRPSPRPYMRTGRSGVRPDGVFHLGRHRHSRHAVKARRIVRTEVRAAVTQLFFMMTYGVVEVYVAIYAVLHRLLSGGIYFIGIAVATVATRILLGRVVVSPVRRDWCTQEMQPLSPGYFCWYSRTTYRATCCRLRYWDTASELCSLPCRPWPCLPKDEVPQALRFSWLSILGLHWEDFRRITREIPGI